ncbi:MAG: glycosyltransferase family 9 protein, partial [Desulfuromonadaceae bacterium]|nr:glycosyltransferase family 9 protein [Desulfuromonadaceae bacterium]
RGEAIVAGLKGTNLAGKTTIKQTAAVLKRAKLLVSGDSGVMHLGIAVGCPTVALFGPGIAKKWAPRAPDCHIVNLELKCAPCTQFGTTPPCPYGAACIRDISVDMVWPEAQKLLKLRD